MANLTEQRLKEMQDEMDRFEEEIQSSKAAAAAALAVAASAGESNAPKMIIGAGTYSQVQAQMVASRTGDHSIAIAGPACPPQFESGSGNTHAAESQIFNLRPPPPPPSFMPHQLRSRPTPPPRPAFLQRGFGGPGGMPIGMMPPPPPPMHMLGGQHNRLNNYLAPPPPPPSITNATSMPAFFNQPGSMMSPPPTFNPMSQADTATIQKQKVVYSAAPVRRVAQSENMSAAPVNQFADKHTVSIASTVTKPPQISLPGIQLNVPVEEIASERLKVTGAVIVPHAESVGAGSSSASASAMEVDAHVPEGSKKEKKEKKKKFVRMAAGTVWEDLTLQEWVPDDFRVFCGDLGNEVTDDTLARAFNKYPSFLKAKVVRDKRSMKTKGFGFVSFKDPNDFVKAMREMNGKYVGNRPIKLRKSVWQDRQIDVVKKKDKEKKKLGFK